MGHIVATATQNLALPIASGDKWREPYGKDMRAAFDLQSARNSPSEFPYLEPRSLLVCQLSHSSWVSETRRLCSLWQAGEGGGGGGLAQSLLCPPSWIMAVWHPTGEAFLCAACSFPKLHPACTEHQLPEILRFSKSNWLSFYVPTSCQPHLLSMLHPGVRKGDKHFRWTFALCPPSHTQLPISAPGRPLPFLCCGNFTTILFRVPLWSVMCPWPAH